MFRLTIKNLLARKLRLFTTSVAVLLGVAFVVGSLGLGNTLNKVFDDVFAGAYKNYDVVVRGAEKPVQDSAQTTQPIPNALAAQLRATPGVRAVDGSLSFPARIVDKAGKVLGGGGPPANGANWIGGDYDAYKISEGKAPQSADEVVIDAASAKKAKFAVGDRITVIAAGGLPVQVQLVGIAKFGDQDSAAGTSTVFFTEARAFTLAGSNDYDELDVVGDGGTTANALRDRVNAAIAPEYDVRTGKQVADEDSKELKSQLSALSIVPLVFGVISLIVSAFIINNTFAILLAQRGREMALLRAVGARRRQVLNSVVIESLLVGVIASVLGLAVGIGVAAGLMALLKKFVVDFPSSSVNVDARMVVIGLVAGIGITIVAAFFPAVRASKIPPLAALREVNVDRSSTSIVRIVIGILLLVGSLVSLGFGFFQDVSPIATIAGGMVGLLIAIYVLGPVYVKPLVAFLGYPAAKLRGTAGFLSRQNAMRNTRRTAATSAALMIGVTLVTFVLVFIASLQGTVTKLVNDTVAGDFIVAGPQDGGDIVELDPKMVSQLDALPETDLVVPVGYAILKLGDSEEFGSAIDPAQFGRLVDVPFSSGKVSDVNASTIAVFKDEAKARNWTVGQELTATFSNAKTVKVKIGAIFDNSQITGSILIDNRTIAEAFGKSPVNQVYVTKTDGTSAPVARAAIENTVKPYVSIEVQDRTDLREAINSQIGIVLNVVLALLALSVIIALFGIANTLALSVFERTREIGLLRAVGMTRRQTRTMIRWESVTLALVGTVVGLVLGVIVGAGVIYALREKGIDVISIPWMQLIIVGVVAVIAGFLVAILPARRASRLNVLDAISTD